MSIFESNIFRGHRVGYGMFGLGDLPEGAAPIARLEVYRRRFPTLPSQSTLQSKGATHATTQVVSGTQQRFTFYDSDGDIILGPFTLSQGGTEPVAPSLNKETAAPPARSEGEGLLPGSSAPAAPASEPKWLPWALLGGGVVVAGGIIWAATRRPKPVAANKRRRRKRRRRRRTSR